MRGEIITIKDDRVKTGKLIMRLLYPEIVKTSKIFVVSVAGESGSGKSGLAIVLSRSLAEKGIKCLILQQDDYFIYPPKTNEHMRRKNLNHVGMSEVQLDLLDQHIKEILDGNREIKKPLVLFEENRITDEVVNVEGVQIVIVEGTYATMLNNVHKRIFIELDCNDTREARLERSREQQDAFLENVLEIEHQIISKQKKHADIIVTKTFDVQKIR